MPQETPQILKTFFILMCLVIGLALLNILCGWIFFDGYSQDFISRHPGSFQGITDASFAKASVAIGLGLRTLVALGWVGALLYLRKMIIRRGKNLYWAVLSCLAIGFVGYLVLAIQGSLWWQELIRWCQVLLFAVGFISFARPSARKQVEQYASIPSETNNQ